MSNSLLTDSIITQECLRVLQNEIVFTKSVNRQYDKQFAMGGAKIGDTINIRKPAKYVANSGATLIVQDSQDVSVALQLDTQRHVGMAFSSKDRALSVDDFSARYIKPAMVTLANALDYDGTAAMYKQVFSAVGVPSATALPSTFKGFGQARACISALGAPTDELVAMIDPFVEASVVDGSKSLFQSAEGIGRQYETGTIGYAAGMRFKMSQNTPKHTAGAFGSSSVPLTDYPSTAYVAGATSLVTNGWSTGAVKAGDVFTIDGVYAVNPQTKQSTGQLAQILCTTALSDTAGSMTIVMDRGLYASGANQNVDALPANDAALNFFGSVVAYRGVVAPQNLVFSRDAFALGCADLPLIGQSTRATDPESGLSIRFWQQGDIINDREITRLDILYGWKCLYPEYACRVVGQPA